MSDKTSGRDTQRIKKEAIDFATEILGQPPFMMDDTIVTGYIAGATAQLKELASLREQLKEITKERDAWISEYNAARAEVERLKMNLYNNPGIW